MTVRRSQPSRNPRRGGGPRLALVQCDGCHAIASARVTGDHLGDVPVGVEWVDRRPRHRGCHGALRLFDIRGAR